MVRPTALMALSVLLASLALPACEGRRKARERARRDLRVDCAALCERTFKTCGEAVLQAAGNTKPERVDSLKATGLWDKLQGAGFEACKKDCDKKQGRGTDAGRINRCLAKKSCADFARCMARVVR